MIVKGSWTKLLLIGLGAGFLAGLMGVGGGVVMVPAMVLLLSMEQHSAHGTSLAIMIVFATIAAATYGLHGAIDWPLAGTLIPGAIVGAFLGARLAGRVPARRLALLFAAFVLLTGARMVYGGLSSAESWEHHLFAGHTGIWLGFVIGLIAGSLGGLLGVGGGIIIVPALTLILGRTQQTSQGTALVAIIATAISGAITHNSLGNVDRRAGIGLALGGIPGSLAGSSLANLMGGQHLTAVFGGFLVVMSAIIAFPLLNGHGELTPTRG